jgi:Protein of unknown function (DUF3096)
MRRALPGRRPAEPENTSGWGIVPEFADLELLQINAAHAKFGNPAGVSCFCIAEPRQRIKSASIRFPNRQLRPENIFMVITSAHIQPIVALVAGILILLMPRLLNLIVAIYLIFIGLVGLGVLRMFHLG